MAFKDFPDTPKGRKERREYYESEDGLLMIESWRRQGIDLKVIATDYIGVSVEAFRRWRKASPAMVRACNVAMDVCNSAVEKSLLKRATGYDYTEEVWELVEGEMMLVRQYKKHMPPDTKAILSWLYNRLPNMWRSVQEPLEQTQYTETIKEILVAMKEVATDGEPKQIETKEVVES